METEYILYTKYGDNHVILDGVHYKDIDCIYDEIFAEQFFGVKNDAL